MTAQMHERTDDGRDRHWMEKNPTTGEWVCSCGETRDRFGRVLEKRTRAIVEAEE